MFARRKSVDDAPAVEAAEAPAVVTGPAAKLMQMLGLSPEALAQTAQEVGAMLQDFRARLDRIEQKLDASTQQQAALLTQRGSDQPVIPIREPTRREKSNGRDEPAAG